MRDVLGWLLLVPAVLVTLAALPWLGWLAWIAWEGRGVDRGFALLFGPSTCMALVPVLALGALGAGLVAGRRPSAPD